MMSRCRVGSKVDWPNLGTHRQQTPVFEWCMVKRGPKNGHQKDVFKRDRTMCSRFVIHSRLASHHILGRDLYDHVMRKRIFTLMINISHMSSKKYEENAYGDNLDLLIILH